MGSPILATSSTGKLAVRALRPICRAGQVPLHDRHRVGDHRSKVSSAMASVCGARWRGMGCGRADRGGPVAGIAMGPDQGGVIASPSCRTSWA